MSTASLSLSEKRVYAGLLLNFAVFGATFMVVAALIPQIIRTFSWSYTVTAVVLASGYVGGMISAPLAGRITARFGCRFPLMAGLLFVACAFGLFARSPSPVYNLSMMLLFGIGNGLNEVITNITVVRLDRSGSGRLMNLMHAAFCVGAVISPLLISSIPGLTIHWRIVFPCAAALVVLMACMMPFLPFAAVMSAPVQPVPAGNHSGKMPITLVLLVLLALSFFYSGSELSVASWVSEYFVKVLDAPLAAGARALAVLWLGILIGRVVIAAGLAGKRHELQLLVMAVFSTVFLLCAVMMRTPRTAGAMVFLTGLSYSGFYPMLVSAVGTRMRNNTAIGMVSSVGTLGAMLFPFFMAVVSDHLGMRGGFLLCCGANAVLVVLCIALSVLSRRKE